LQVADHSLRVSLRVGNWEITVHGTHVKQQPGSIFSFRRSDKWFGIILFLLWWTPLQKLDDE
jgi:hypothetical protein